MICILIIRKIFQQVNYFINLIYFYILASGKSHKYHKNSYEQDNLDSKSEYAEEMTKKTISKFEMKNETLEEIRKRKSSTDIRRKIKQIRIIDEKVNTIEIKKVEKKFETNYKEGRFSFTEVEEKEETEQFVENLVSIKKFDQFKNDGFTEEGKDGIRKFSDREILQNCNIVDKITEKIDEKFDEKINDLKNDENINEKINNDRNMRKLSNFNNIHSLEIISDSEKNEVIN